MNNTSSNDYSIIFDKINELRTENLTLQIEKECITHSELEDINALREIVATTMKKEQLHLTIG